MELTIQVKKSFGSFTLSADCSLSGERIGIFGPSGGGKSTLVRLIAGLERPESGEICLDGEILFSSSRRINLPPEKRRIAIVFQDARLFPHLNVHNNLLYGCKRCVKKGESGIDFAQLVATLQLDELLERGVENLSGGQKQRVALGRAILANPRLLLMDEPLSALDDSLRFQIIPYLRSVSEEFGIPYLFISHSLLEVRLMTEQAMTVSGGVVAPPLPTEELARRTPSGDRSGYVNLLRLKNGEIRDGLHSYPFGNGRLALWEGGDEDALFELAAREIMLLRGRAEAISARNLLECTIVKLFTLEERSGVELACGDARVVATVVRQAADELQLKVGEKIFTVIKASAFRRLY